MKKNKKQNLDAIFNPGSIAIVGASRDEKSVGHAILRNLAEGCVFNCKYCKPFKGSLYPINPNADEILGVKCYPGLKDVDGKIDLAIIAVPAKIVPSVMRDCAKKGVKGIIIISAGFAELGMEGKKLQDEVVKIAKTARIPLVGPNCLGIIRPFASMNASFAPSMPPQGSVAFISQSGALADSIIDWSIEERYGFSTVISYGNHADLDVYDFLEWLGNDGETKAIALYIEGMDDGRRFMEVAKRVSRIKPVVVLKAGKTQTGKNAVSSHTGSLAGSYEVYEAAFKQSNVIIADTVEELFDIAKALAYQLPCKGNAIAIVTNGGGCGVLCADKCSEYGVNVVELKQSTIKKLDESGKMHPAYSRRNPLDIVGDALPERYEIAINTLLGEDYIHGMIVIQTLQAMTNSVEDAKIVIEAHKKFPNKPIVCTYMGGKFSRESIDLLKEHKIPDYNDLSKSAKAMQALVLRGKYLKKIGERMC